jgi:endonuclease/exonuclease/phosphatase family metal-dependent hydrolase
VKVRALTWNIHGGVGRDGRFDLARIVDLICRWEPDIVALQEVDSRRCAAGDVPAFEFITGELGFHAVEAKTLIAKDGEYGQMLISRWALGKTAIHDISVPRREPRRAIEADIETPSGPIHVLAAHFGLSVRERRTQAKALAKIAGMGPRTSIILGDFNDWIRGQVQEALAEEFSGLSPHKTWPAFLPLLRLDRIFCRPADALIETWTDRKGGAMSDHLPVIADIKLSV